MNNDWSHFNAGFSLKLVFEIHEGIRSLCMVVLEHTAPERSTLLLKKKMVGIKFYFFLDKNKG